MTIVDVFRDRALLFIERFKRNVFPSVAAFILWRSVYPFNVCISSEIRNCWKTEVLNYPMRNHSAFTRACDRHRNTKAALISLSGGDMGSAIPPTLGLKTEGGQI